MTSKFKKKKSVQIVLNIGLSGKFVPYFLVGGVRTGLNISERLKMTCVHIVKDGTSGILGNKFGCDMLIFVSLYAL